MNRKRREFLTALAPAATFAKQQAPKARADVPGLHLVNRIANEAPAEIMIYGQIGGGFWSDGISASDVAAALQQAGPGPVKVRINSPGGDVFQGTAIYSLLSQHPGLVTVDVDGLAASAASIIMLSGDLIRAPKHAFVMIHDAMTFTYGNPATHREAADLLDKVSGTLAEMYADRAGEDADHWRAIMTEHGEDGTWYTGAEAHAANLVDEIITTAKGEDEVTDDELVAARLDGWQNFLAPQARAFLEQHRPAPEPDNVPAHVAWDHQALIESLKGVLA